MRWRCRVFRCAYDMADGTLPTIVCRRCRTRVVCVDGWWLTEERYLADRAKRFEVTP